MNVTVSFSLSDDEVVELDEIAAKEKIDRSALIRRFLIQQIKEYRLKNVSEKYRKGIISLTEAATLAKVTIYDMMEYCKREQIRPIEPDSSELAKDRKNAEDIFRKLKEEK